jgi:hypothetical protein
MRIVHPRPARPDRAVSFGGFVSPGQTAEAWLGNANRMKTPPILSYKLCLIQIIPVAPRQGAYADTLPFTVSATEVAVGTRRAIA